MVSFEIFVKAMPPSLSKLKVLPSFCFAFKIPDNVTVTTIYSKSLTYYISFCIPNQIPVSSPALGLSRWKCYLFGLLGPQIWTIHSGSAFLFEFGSIDGTFVGGSIVTDARS